jgi:phenylacetate-CoA ligase
MKVDRYLQIYHRMPWRGRIIVATLRGLYLRYWRYGPESERLVDDALERELWSPKQWTSHIENRLAYVLERAARHVPYYRKYWTDRRLRGDSTSWEYLENWPILEKESLRGNAYAFVADDCNTRKMFHEHTSGTTGKPLNLWWSRPTVQMWYALFEARCRRWYGVSRQDRWAILGGQLIAPVSERRPPFWLWNVALNQLYMSSYHLAPDLISHYLDALKKYQIAYIFGYTSSIYALAQQILHLERKDFQMAVAVTNAEPLFEYQRRVISEAFQCPVRQTYGMAEIVASASECHEGSLHLWPEVGFVEVFANQKPVTNGSPGDLICTGLINTDMPLVRYRVGDQGSLGTGDKSCACGRILPKLASVEGRIDDVLYTVDGRRIGRLDPVFKEDLALHEAQIIQEGLSRVRLRYVPDKNFSSEKECLMIKRLQERMGAVDILLERLREIPREHNGKFRAVICQIPEEEKKYLTNPQGQPVASQPSSASSHTSVETR